MKKMLNILVGGLLLAATTSCEHKDLCYDHGSHALKYQTNVRATYEQEWQYTYESATDWKNAWPTDFTMAYDDLRPGIPAGLRVLSFDESNTRNMTNLPAEGGILSLTEGNFSLLFYNNDTEYIVFDDLASYASARATTRSRSRNTYLGNPYSKAEEENTVNAPDMLYGNYRDSYVSVKSTSAPNLDVTMHPLVFTYVVNYEFEHGLEYVALARGALAGMAEAVYLNSGQTSADVVTILYDCNVENNGVQAVVNSFGVPDYPNENYSRAENVYGLNLEVRLKNGVIKNFDFDVTDQVAKQPHGGVITVSGINITDEEGASGGSGFQVEVSNWGEYEDIIIPLGN